MSGVLDHLLGEDWPAWIVYTFTLIPALGVLLWSVYRGRR